MSELTQQYLKDHFEYVPETGELFRTVILDRWGNKALTRKSVGTLRSDGYLEVAINKRTYKIHRLVFLYVTGKWPTEVDHINGDRADNRLINLRDVSKSVNMRNKKIHFNNTSGHPGVTWFTDTCQWRARVNFNGVRYSLGLFDTIEEAIAARMGAQRILGYHENHGREHNEN